MENSKIVDNDDIINVVESKNEIYFNASINAKNISTLINKLLNLQEKILKKTKGIKRKLADEEDTDIVKIKIEPMPIKLYITSDGGLVYQVFNAIDTINNMTVPVNTICLGMVASAGTLLSLAGKKRFITENSFMHIHEIRSGCWGKYSVMKEHIENSKNLMEHIKKYYIKKTKMTEDEIETQLKQDNTWDAETCLTKGLVDEIIKFT